MWLVNVLQNNENAFFYHSSFFSAPKWNQLAQQMKSQILQKVVLVDCNMFFIFGTEKKEEQLKKDTLYDRGTNKSVW